MSDYKYSKLPTAWIDDFNVMSLGDSEFRIFVTQYIENPANIFVERNRNSWFRVRKKMTKLVFDRDAHECRYCGSSENLTIDHIYPYSRGGSNELDNLQILCRSCNSKKYNKVR